jgi:hypothetical protein
VSRCRGRHCCELAGCFLSYVMCCVRLSPAGKQFLAELINLSYDPITYVVMVLISSRTVLHADSSVLNLSDTLRRHVPSTIVC